MTVPEDDSSSPAAASSAAVKSKRAQKRAKQKENKNLIKQAFASSTSSTSTSDNNSDAGNVKSEDESKMSDTAAAPRVDKTAARLQAISEYSQDEADLKEDNDLYGAFAGVMGKFMTPQELALAKIKAAEEQAAEEKLQQEQEESGFKKAGEKLVDVFAAAEGQVEGEPKKKLSKKEKRLRSRLSVAELKQLVDNPEQVEIHDCNSSDPKLLMFLKSYRNSVTVPGHWSARRKYLQGKRGFEKPAFKLPEFIEATGIGKMRAAQQEKDAEKKSKNRQREKMQPKMGKIDIDYQVLHDAFFKNQTRPASMTRHGEVYYEGREFEAKLKTKRPGELSEELMRALGMKSAESPPPWLLNMQRYGPPPSYPNFKIPGVSAPIPPGCRYGFGEGEWGRPPVDEYGRPRYGDVFGTDRSLEAESAPVDKSLWGVVLVQEEEEEEEGEGEGEGAAKEGEGDDESEGEEDNAAGMASVVPGEATPDIIQLRKRDGTGTETPDTINRSLFTVLEEKKDSVGGSFFGTTHTYVVPPSSGQSAEAAEMERRREERKRKILGQVNVALNPEDLEDLDAATLKRKYDAQVEAEKAAIAAERDDVSGVAEEMRKKKRKTADKKKTDFKF
jgi:splicing factor 3B subunit 2